MRRGDGQVLQLTPLLYLVLNAADGRRSYAQIAELVGRGLGKNVTEANVRTLVDRHLRPLGLLQSSGGPEPEFRRSSPLLSLKPRIAITNPRTTRCLTGPFRILFRPVVAVPVLVGFLAVVTWVFFERGLGASAYDAFERPQLLLLVFVAAVLSGGFHEFGHAAAARYGGAEPGAMGAGLYIAWPAFYTDVTDSYRLDRVGRIRTDLGGLYFNAIVVVMTFVWWWATGWEALLLLVAVQVLQMVQQMLPLLRFDGYHLLADLAGVPDLYQRIRPTLLGLLPHRWKSPENKALRPSARTLIRFWVLVTIPMMALMLLGLIKAVPRLLGSAGSVIGEDAIALAGAWRAGDALDVAGHAAQVLAVVMPALACALILGRTGFRFFRRLLRWSHGSPPKRLAASAVTALLVTGLCWAWWPDPGTYRPIEARDRGLITTLLPARQAQHDGPGQAAGSARSDARAMGIAPPVGTAAQSRLSSGRPLAAVFPRDESLPTKQDPALAMVLVPAAGVNPSAPKPGAGTTTASARATEQPTPASTPSAEDPTSSGSSTDPDDTWVFPFDKPLPPEPGDNQALAVATTDGAVTYDLAFALVWATGDKVLNVNEAHAYASCSDCVAVAVAFQVVLIMDDAQVVVPQNLAVAATYDCYRCITAAVASQLVLSVQEEPGQEELRALGDVWNRLIEFAGTIPSRTLVDISTQLETFKAEIVGILGEAPPVQPLQSPESTMSPLRTTTGPPASADQTPTANDSPTEPQSPTADTTERPTSDATADEPLSDTSTEDPARDTPSDEPASDGSSDEPAADGSSDEPAADASSDEPTADASSDEPAPDTTTDEPTSGDATDEPVADDGTSPPR